MTLSRRLFLGALAAPAIVRASSLMPIWVPPLILYGDDVHADHEALQAWVDGGRKVVWPDGTPVGSSLVGRRFRIGNGIEVAGPCQEKLIMDCTFSWQNEPGPYMFRLKSTTNMFQSNVMYASRKTVRQPRKPAA